MNQDLGGGSNGGDVCSLIPIRVAAESRFLMFPLYLLFNLIVLRPPPSKGDTVIKEVNRGSKKSGACPFFILCTFLFICNVPTFVYFISSLYLKL